MQNPIKLHHYQQAAFDLFQSNVAAGVPSAVAIRPSKPALILNAAQAEAVYSAMCALNNVCGIINKIEIDADITVSRSSAGVIKVAKQDGSVEPEYYGAQYLFAAAYGIATGA